MTVDPLDPHDPESSLELLANPYMMERPRLEGTPRVELPGLDEVDWAGLTDAYGPANCRRDDPFPRELARRILAAYGAGDRGLPPDPSVRGT